MTRALVNGSGMQNRNLVFTNAHGGFGLGSPQGVQGSPSDWTALLTGWPARRIPVFTLGKANFTDKGGARPIGWFGEELILGPRLPRDGVMVQAIALPYEGAIEAAQSNYFRLGPGIVRIR